MAPPPAPITSQSLPQQNNNANRNTNKSTNSTSNTGNPRTITLAERRLQERLHDLLSLISATQQHIKSWPEAPPTEDNSSSIHVESTTQLIAHIRRMLDGIVQVENQVQEMVAKPPNNQPTSSAPQSTWPPCPIPLDLLDLMDATDINPDCFTRGLLREALGQLAGLKRRKLALELLGVAVQSGWQQQQRQRRRQQLEPEPSSLFLPPATTTEVPPAPETDPVEAVPAPEAPPAVVETAEPVPPPPPTKRRIHLTLSTRKTVPDAAGGSEPPTKKPRTDSSDRTTT